ncbi:DUF5806 family protein [Methanoplanus endosymbiosus]|uniref:DUF5806 family protein n=1 Tax=Methanoplanus endosymbiosus TaxID=33865 RepID=A0A9E7PM60_9EURY|nr:DUF5806 family protein [Methanoplanus endosymbiosus]UUX92749.1 DUF5806 family protein [Methanoplanus endosymbiosus]
MAKKENGKIKNPDENMNPEEAQDNKPDDDIYSVIDSERNKVHTEVTSKERTDYNKSAMPEELPDLKDIKISNGAEFTGMSEDTGRSDEKEMCESADGSERQDKTERSDKKEIPNNPDMADNSEQDEGSDNADVTDKPEDERLEDKNVIDKPLSPDNPEESETANDDIDQEKSDYQTEITDKLTPEEKERINKYKKFKKVDGSTYRRVNQFLRKHTYITAREWAIARLCADFSTRGGAEMTFIGENLPELIPFMTDTYSPQAVNQARSSFKKKVKKSGATFFYGALCGFFTADELDDILFESSEVARFLLEIEGTSVDLDDEIDIEDKITDVMRSVAEASSMIRAPKTVSDEPEDDFEYEDIPGGKIPEECYSDIEELTEDSGIRDE